MDRLPTFEEPSHQAYEVLHLFGDDFLELLSETCARRHLDVPIQLLMRNEPVMETLYAALATGASGGRGGFHGATAEQVRTTYEAGLTEFGDNAALTNLCRRLATGRTRLDREAARIVIDALIERKHP
jgi:hypothetical protein